MWGRSGEVYEPEEVDEKDPNYDEAQVLTVVLILYIFNYTCRVWNSMVTSCNPKHSPTINTSHMELIM